MEIPGTWWAYIYLVMNVDSIMNNTAMYYIEGPSVTYSFEVMLCTRGPEIIFTFHEVGYTATSLLNKLYDVLCLSPELISDCLHMCGPLPQNSLGMRAEVIPGPLSNHSPQPHRLFGIASLPYHGFFIGNRLLVCYIANKATGLWESAWYSTVFLTGLLCFIWLWPQGDGGPSRT